MKSDNDLIGVSLKTFFKNRVKSKMPPMVFLGERKAKAEADLDWFPVSLFLIVLVEREEKSKLKRDSQDWNLSRITDSPRGQTLERSLAVLVRHEPWNALVPDCRECLHREFFKTAVPFWATKSVSLYERHSFAFSYHASAETSVHGFIQRLF